MTWTGIVQPDVMSASLEKSTRRMRNRGSKVRSGCFKCKARKIKCDEEKPGCARCRVYGCLCPGYLSGSQKAASISSSSTTDDLLPKPQPKRISLQREQTGFRDNTAQRQAKEKYDPQTGISAQAQMDYIKRSSFVRSPLWINPSTSIFQDEYQYRYFQSFSEELVPRFHGAFVLPSTWSELIMEAIQIEPSLRYVAVAIAALQKALDVPMELLTRPFRMGVEMEQNAHYWLALHSYQRAISYLKSITSARIALVASLLFSSFETLNGRPDLAISTLKSGFKLLKNLRKDLGGSKKLLVASIGTNLIRVFGRLCIQVMPYSGIQDMPFYNILCHENFDGEIPPVFSTISEARTSLENIIVRSLSGHMSSDSWGKTVVSSESAVLDYADMTSSSNPASRALLGVCISDNMRWARAFEPFVTNLRNSISQEDVTNIIALQLHSKTTAILLARNNISESSFDGFFDDFQEIVDLCMLQLSQPHFSKPALFVSYGVNLPLFITASKCRHRATRHRAINLLKATNRQEGVLTGALAGAVGAWLAGLEEAQDNNEDTQKKDRFEEEFIAEERRVRLSRLALDYGLKTARVACTFCEKSPIGEIIQAETTLSWD